MISQANKLTESEYIAFRDLVLEKSGLDFSDQKRNIFDAKVYSCFSKSAFPSLNLYYNFLRFSSESGKLLEQLINSLTVGETHFFRNTPQFDALKEQILPEIFKQKKQDNNLQIRIWSAGCATGEEPYSLAILLKEILPDIEAWNILILATDINRNYLERAKEGIYSDWSFRSVPDYIKIRYFDNRKGKYHISAEIKTMVNFVHFNLIQDDYPSISNNVFAMDLILCRNVTIYFRQEQVQQVVNKIYDTLIDGGWLIVGHSEPAITIYNKFKCLNFPGTSVYKKIETLTDEKIVELAPINNFIAATNVYRYIQLPTLEEKKQVKVNKPQKGQQDTFGQGLILLKHGHLEKALAKFEENLKSDPSSLDTYYMIARIYADIGRLDTALEVCQKALQVNKLSPRMYYLIGMIYSQKEQLEQAVEFLKKALYLDQNFIMAYVTLAHIYRKQGKKKLLQRCLGIVKLLLENLPEGFPIPEAEGDTPHSLLQTLVGLSCP